jgi:hypothetical protein
MYLDTIDIPNTIALIVGLVYLTGSTGILIIGISEREPIKEIVFFFFLWPIGLMYAILELSGILKAAKWFYYYYQTYKTYPPNKFGLKHELRIETAKHKAKGS